MGVATPAILYRYMVPLTLHEACDQSVAARVAVTMLDIGDRWAIPGACVGPEGQAARAPAASLERVTIRQRRTDETRRED